MTVTVRKTIKKMNQEGHAEDVISEPNLEGQPGVGKVLWVQDATTAKHWGEVGHRRKTSIVGGEQRKGDCGAMTVARSLGLSW
jgi:hypothetical protein